MYKPKTEKDIKCPMEYGMDIFGGKWKPRIICMLGLNGTMRYGELKKQLENITDTVLASTLKEMIGTDIVKRIQYDEIPPRLEYALTDTGLSLIPVLGNICLWSEMRLGVTDKPGFCTNCYYKRDNR